MLYINACTCAPPEIDPAELEEVETLIAEAHAFEPIRSVEDLSPLGRVVAIQGKAQQKDYSQEWPKAKANAIARYLLPTMHLSYSTATPA